MLQKIQLICILFILSFVTSTALAVAPSWWGGEIHANQMVGYGKYEATLIPGTGAGSITGLFNLCYTNDFKSCVNYNPNDANHFETDVEFTPTGNTQVTRLWVTSCLTDLTCNTYYPNPWPRDGNGNLQAVSFNTFPHDNQLYYQPPFDPYTTAHVYTFVNLPTEVYWEVDGKKILSRVPSSSIGPRNYPAYVNFKTILQQNQATLIINLWDGSQGASGGFGGPSTVQQTAGNPAIIQRVAYYPATCTTSKVKSTNCVISKTPTFLTDFVNNQFIKNGSSVTVKQGDPVCATQSGIKDKTFWVMILRTAFPVYVSPGHVTCSYPSNGIQLNFSSSQ